MEGFDVIVAAGGDGTVNEVLPDAYNLVVWWGLLGPAGLPRPMVDRINVEAGKALRIAVHDHLVVGREGVASLKALGLM